MSEVEQTSQTVRGCLLLTQRTLRARLKLMFGLSRDQSDPVRALCLSLESDHELPRIHLSTRRAVVALPFGAGAQQGLPVIAFLSGGFATLG
jgi:hypothetical protein